MPSSDEVNESHARNWYSLAETLVNNVAAAKNREAALAACMATAEKIHSRGDVFQLGRELSAYRERSGDRRKGEIASAIAKCFYERIAPFNPLPTMALLLISVVATIVVLATGHTFIGLLLCALIAGLIARIAIFYLLLRRPNQGKPADGPVAKDFLRLTCIRELPSITSENS